MPIPADQSADERRVEEAAFIGRLRAGDDCAYETLVREHLGKLLTIARRFLRNEDDARDAVQEAFLSAFKSIGRFDGHSQLGTWLHRIAINACLMKIRSRQSRPERSIEDLLPEFLVDGHQAQPAKPWGISAEAALQRRELRELVRSSIDRLPEPHRTVLLMRDIEGIDTVETAEALGLTTGAVKTRLHRARQALRTLLDPFVRGEAP